ncbi:MAG: Hpt domain-containing protein [Thiotrichales bacterium]
MPENESTLEELIAQYRASFPKKRKQFSQLLNELKQNRPAEAAATRLQIHQAAHRLAGSAPLYGFEGLAQAARTLKDLESADIGEIQAAVEAVIESLDNDQI